MLRTQGRLKRVFIFLLFGCAMVSAGAGLAQTNGDTLRIHCDLQPGIAKGQDAVHFIADFTRMGNQRLMETLCIAKAKALACADAERSAQGNAPNRSCGEGCRSRGISFGECSTLDEGGRETAGVSVRQNFQQNSLQWQLACIAYFRSQGAADPAAECRNLRSTGFPDFIVCSASARMAFDDLCIPNRPQR